MLGSRPQPQLRVNSPCAKTCRRRRAPPPGSRVNTWRGAEPPRGKKRQPSLFWLKSYLAGAECASRMAELQLCSEARSGRVAGARLLCPGRALPRLASLLGFLPRQEPAARGWESPLAPSWPQLRSCLAFEPRTLASFGRVRARILHTAKAPGGRALCQGKEGLEQGPSSGCLAAQTQRRTECTRLPGPLAVVCSPANPEADSLGAQQLPHTRSFPSAVLPSRDVCSWLGPAPGCLGSRPQPQLRASSP